MHNKLTLLIAIILVLVLLAGSNSFAGEIKNLNIKATDGSKIEVKTNHKSNIKNINVKKDPTSEVIINEPREDCDKTKEQSGICKPEP